MSPAAAPPRATRAVTAQRTRLALLEAGLAEISLQGLGASLDSICARAGLTRGAFYVHFADREAFLIAVMHHVLGTFVATLTGATAGSVAGAITHFFALADARDPAVHADSSLRFHHVMEACRRSRPIGDAYRQLVVIARDQLAQRIAKDQRAGLARTELAPAAFADLLLVAALGVAATFELELPLGVPGVGESLLLLAAPPAPRPARSRRSER